MMSTTKVDNIKGEVAGFGSGVVIMPAVNTVAKRIAATTTAAR